LHCEISKMKYLIVVLLMAFASASELLGGHREVAIENAIIDEVAHFAVSRHPGETLEEGYFDGLDRVVSAKKQTVAGYLYTLDLSVGSSGCSLKSEYDKTACKIKASSGIKRCTAEVVVQVWMKPQNYVKSWECQ